MLGGWRPQYNDLWKCRCELCTPGIPRPLHACRHQIPEGDARGGHQLLAMLRLPFHSVHRRGALVRAGSLAAKHLRGNYTRNHAKLPGELNRISAFGLASSPMPDVKEGSVAALVREHARHNRCDRSPFGAFCRSIPCEQL